MLAQRFFSKPSHSNPTGREILSDYHRGGSTMMNMPVDDRELLRRYVKEGSEESFAELVRRHINLAWGAARRVTGDADLARDIAQKTFCLLARKARFMPDRIVIPGWIYRTACLEARKALRDAARRTARERKAMELNLPQLSDSDTTQEIEALLPRLDTALCGLSGKDRDAVVLRFLENRSLAEVGAALGVSEDAAQKRVSRVIETLRKRMSGRAALIGSALLTNALAAAGSQAAPAGMAGTISVASVSATTAATGGLSTLLFNLKTQAAFMKAKLITGTVATVTVATPLVVQQQTLNELRAENETLAGHVTRVDALREESETLANRESLAREFAQLQENHVELLRLRDEVAALTSAETERKVQLSQRRDALRREAQRIHRESELLANQGRVHLQIMNDMKQLGLFAHIFANANDDRLATSFEEMIEDQSIASEFDNIEDLSKIEFYPHEMPVEITQPQAILFRERVPRQLRSGKWTRNYTLMDGSVQSISSEEPDFSWWEQQQMERALAQEQERLQRASVPPQPDDE